MTFHHFDLTRQAVATSLVFIFSAAGNAWGWPEEDQKDNSPNTHQEKHLNRLSKATSPYLLQHAHNPVDWYEWGEEAFAKAKEEDKPIFLSIGYSACHWCHVMAHESFESEEVAAVLNEHFVNIKVDREERPDIDEIYMAFTQALTQHGGWPMSVWMAPDATPFHAGTYFPKEQFQQLLLGIAEAWKNEREKVVGGAENIREFFQSWSSDPKQAAAPVGAEDLVSVANKLASYFDGSLGGISSANNKFPPSMSMDLLLRIYKRTGQSELFQPVEITLDRMAHGGIYDHLGGGICRYSTDPQWLVPHFEKMLYDQALVSNIYLDGYQLTRKPLYRKTAADIFDYVLEDLQAPEGGFYSARDADSDGLEGKFYIWTVEQVHAVLGKEEGELFCAYYDVTETGNWFERLGHAPAGPKNILHISKPPEAFAKLHNLSVDALNKKIASWRTRMLAERAKRTAPGLDDKVLTGWNGLMIASLAKGSRVLDEPRYAAAAAKASSFVLEKLRRDGRLLRTHRNGESRLTGYLNDYAFLIAGLINLYEATFEQRWLDEAKALMDTSIEHYHDEERGAFFFTADDAEVLIARSKQPHDGAIPSGNSIQAMNLLRLSILFNDKSYREKANVVFKNYASPSMESPTAFDALLCAVDFSNDKVKEIAIIGDRGSSDMANLVRCVYDRYLPNKVVVGGDGSATQSPIPLLNAKTRQKGRATAYVCENYRCRLPVTSAEELARELDKK